MMNQIEINHRTSKILYTIGGLGAFLQLAAIVGYWIALGVLGPKPASAEEYYMIQQSSKLEEEVS